MSGIRRLYHLINGIAALILALAVLSSCSGKNVTQLGEPEASLPESYAAVDFHAQAPLESVGPPQMVPDANGIPLPGSVGDNGNFSARQTRYSISTVVGGEDYYLKSAAALPDDYHGLMRLYTATDPVCWSVYAVDGFTHGEVIKSLEISMRRPWPSRFFVGISNFELGTWHWLAADLIDDSVALLVPVGLHAIDGNGRALVCIVAPRGEYVEFSSITFRRDVPAPPPLGLSATQGDHKWSIELTWEDPAGSYEGLAYQSILVYRRRIDDQNFSLLAELPVGTTSYHDQYNDPDNPLAAETAMFYRLRTNLAGGAGPPSEPVTGWLGPAPLNLTAQQAIVPDRIVLSWDPHPYAQSAVLEYREAGATEYTELWALDEVTSDSFEHTKTSPPGHECELGQEYEYRLRYTYFLQRGRGLCLGESRTGTTDRCRGYLRRLHR